MGIGKVTQSVHIIRICKDTPGSNHSVDYCDGN
jgi:hypothetical protein